MNNVLVVISVLVLLPMIPAFVLFKLLRSKGNVSGPLGSFKIALGGAFGGYFALTVFITTVAVKADVIKPAAPVWHVRGTLQFDDGDGAPEIKCTVLPPH